MVQNRTQLYRHDPNIWGMLYLPAPTNWAEVVFLQGLGREP